MPSWMFKVGSSGGRQDIGLPVPPVWHRDFPRENGSWWSRSNLLCLRSWRYSNVLNDGTIEKVFVKLRRETGPTDPFEVSARTMLPTVERAWHPTGRCDARSNLPAEANTDLSTGIALLPYTMPMSDPSILIVLGAGIGGGWPACMPRAGRLLTGRGWRSLRVDAGGLAPVRDRGCVPKKFVGLLARYASLLCQCPSYGWERWYSESGIGALAGATTAPSVMAQ